MATGIVDAGQAWLIIRSDGTLTRPTDGARCEPRPEQLAGVFNNQGYMDVWRKLADDSPKMKNFLEEIGKEYSKEVPGNIENIILPFRQLPRHFSLWERHQYHTTTTDPAGKLNKDRKDLTLYNRKDYYVFGHHSGKYYSSRLDLLPHLIWLGCDETGISSNCVCKLCVKTLAGGDDNAHRIKQTISNMCHTRDERQAEAALVAVSTERLFDLEAPIKYLFRPGEIVWYDVYGNSTNWRLAAISRRRLSGESKAEYWIQPLSNPRSPQPARAILQTSLRPWLAWSYPLPVIKPPPGVKLFDDVNWEEALKGTYGRNENDPECVIDGSILAAQQVDASYSLFNKLQTTVSGSETQHSYIGMFLGAEKVWVGEPVRLLVPGSQEVIVMVIKFLIETSPTAAADSSTASSVSDSILSASTLTIIGDVYELVETNQEREERYWQPRNFPTRMAEDIRWRNNISRSKGRFLEWKAREVNVKRGIADIAGRWYETKEMVSYIRDGGVIQQEMRVGTMKDVGKDLNRRMHQTQATLSNERRKNRKHTFGESVPADLKISKGRDGPEEDDKFPGATPPSRDNVPMDLDN